MDERLLGILSWIRCRLGGFGTVLGPSKRDKVHGQI